LILADISPINLSFERYLIPRGFVLSLGTATTAISLVLERYLESISKKITHTIVVVTEAQANRD